MCVDTVFSGHICLYFIGQSDSKVGGQTGGREGPANQTLAAIGTFVFLIYILFFCLLPSLEGPQLDQERDWGKTRSKDLDLKPGCCISALQQMVAPRPMTPSL